MDGLESLIEEERVKYRQPKKGTAAYRVRCIKVEKFRRCGIVFNAGEPQVVDASTLSAAQAHELLNTPTLEVEELTSLPSAPPAPPADPPPGGDTGKGKGKESGK